MHTSHAYEVISDRYLTKTAVQQRYDNCSVMWIHRRLHDDSGFPKPVYIARRPYWSELALSKWERSLASKKGA